MDTMTISVDYWKIEIEDTISNIGATTILEQCGLYGVLCDQVVRNASGSLWQGTQGYVVDTTLTLVRTQWEGIDLAFNWAIDGWGGTWTTNLIGTYMMTKEITPLPLLLSQLMTVLVSSAHVASRHRNGVIQRHFSMIPTSGGQLPLGGVTSWVLTMMVQRIPLHRKNMGKDQNYVDLSARFIFMENHDLTLVLTISLIKSHRWLVVL